MYKCTISRNVFVFIWNFYFLCFIYLCAKYEQTNPHTHISYTMTNHIPTSYYIFNKYYLN